MTSEGNQSPKFTFSDDDGRAQVTSYVQLSKFRVGDKVYVRHSGGGSREGPYVVASVPIAGRYTLSTESGQTIRNSNEIDEKDLEAA